MASQKLNYLFTYGVGGGEEKMYLLNLNGGISKGYPLKSFSILEAIAVAIIEVKGFEKVFSGVTKVYFEIDFNNDFIKKELIKEYAKKGL